MKISLVIEAESPADFQAALDVLNAQMAMNTARWLAQEVPGENPVPKEPPVQPAIAPEPEPEPEPEPVEQEAPVAPAEPPVAAKKRGRRTKAEMQAARAAAAPVEVVAAAIAPAPVNGRQSAFTRDDLTAVFREYVTRYGYSAAASDVSKLLQQNLGAGVRKSSDVSDDAIPRAIEIVRAAVTENPFKREIAANG